MKQHSCQIKFANEFYGFLAGLIVFCIATWAILDGISRPYPPSVTMSVALLIVLSVIFIYSCSTEDWLKYNCKE